MLNLESGQRELPVSNTIPYFQSREEEAAFWNTHAFTEFLDEIKPVKPRVRKSLSEDLTDRLYRDDPRELESRA